MSRLARCLAIAAVAVLSACSSATYRSDWDTQANFTDYTQFAWFDRVPRRMPPPGPSVSPLVVERVERSVIAELEARGFSSVPVKSADFLVTYYVGIDRRVSIHHMGYGYPGWGWRWGWGGGWGGGHSRMHSYPVGSVVVDVIDSSSRQLVWRGVGEAVFTNPDPPDQKVAKVVSRILVDFPPQG